MQYLLESGADPDALISCDVGNSATAGSESCTAYPKEEEQFDDSDEEDDEFNEETYSNGEFEDEDQGTETRQQCSIENP